MTSASYCEKERENVDYWSASLELQKGESVNQPLEWSQEMQNLQEPPRAEG